MPKNICFGRAVAALFLIGMGYYVKEFSTNVLNCQDRTSFTELMFNNTYLIEKYLM